MDNKKLYKSKEGSVIGGVCKGFSELYNWDVSLVRLFTVLAFLFFSGVPFIVYIVMWIVLPNKNDVVSYKDPAEDYTIHEDEYKIDDDDYLY